MRTRAVELAEIPSREWQELQGAPAEEILTWSVGRWGRRLAVFTSFQAEGMVILDLVCRFDLDVRVLTLDTGRLPEETFDHWDAIRNHYGIAIEVVMPEPSAVEGLVTAHGPNLFRVDPELRAACCRVRKVEPFRRALAGLSAWISGLRRTHSADRAGSASFELDLANDPAGGLVKISPLVDWTVEQVWSYLRRHRVPIHPLYERGYHSIGCAPCSRPMGPAEQPRATRWWWEKGEHRECGLHSSGPEVIRSDQGSER